MLDLSPSSRLRPKQQGFTFIELLMVIAVILILAGITFGISRVVQNAQARAKAKAELATISQAIEQFKSVNGDYPWTNDVEGEDPSIVLSKSLLGWKEFVSSGNTTTFQDKTSVPTSGPEGFIDATKLSINGTLPTGATKPTNVEFTDPWGNEYLYLYKENASWDNFGYVLYSKGPDGSSETVPDTGIRPAVTGKDVDNIYAGE